MRFAWIGYGLLGLAGTSALAIELTFRSFYAEPPRARNRSSERLESVAPSDGAWLGTYQLFSDTEQIELRVDGRYRARLDFFRSESDSWCGTGRSFEDRTGTWVRKDAIVVLQPDDPAPVLELELGRLDGEYVLLSEFSTWRRVPEARATSSSR